MKLRQISENLMMQQLRTALASNGPYFMRPNLQTTFNYTPSTGHDAGASTAGATLMPTGIPKKQRHRQYLGLERRSGAIRL